MGWILEGCTVRGNYHGAEVVGVVTHSRVALAGKVKHHVELSHGFDTCGGKIRRAAGESIILRGDEVEVIEAAA